MKKLPKALLVLCQLGITFAASTNLSSFQSERARLIKALETEKGELYKQIKLAINNSLAVLGKTNESESLVAQKYLKELEQQVKEINETDAFEDENARRKYEAISNYIEKNPFEIHRGPKTTLPPFYQIKVEQDIRDWIAEKKLEQKQIKKIKLKVKLLDYEKEDCPNNGFDKKRSYKVDGKNKIRRAYPCCRKCCKRSYLGCL